MEATAGKQLRKATLVGGQGSVRRSSSSCVDGTSSLTARLLREASAVSSPTVTNNRRTSILGWIEDKLQVSRDVLLFAVAIKGLLFGCVQPWALKAIPYWFNAHGPVSASTRSILESIVSAPWGLRSLVCAVMVPSAMFRGRKAYLATLQGLAIMAYFAVGTVNPSNMPLEAATMCFFVAELSAVAAAVVVDGQVSRAVRSLANGQQSQRLASTFYLILNVFALLSLPVVGLCLDRLPVKRSFAPFLVVLSAIVLVLVVAFLDDSTRAISVDSNDALKLDDYGDGYELAVTTRDTASLGKRKVSEPYELSKLGGSDGEDSVGADEHIYRRSEEATLSPIGSCHQIDDDYIEGVDDADEEISSRREPLSDDLDAPQQLVGIEPKRIKDERSRNDESDSYKHTTVALLVGIMSAIIVTLPLLGVRFGELFCISVVFASCAGVANYYVLGPSIGLINAYQQIVLCCRPNLNSATFLFYTDRAAVFPNGPHLSPLFYTTAIGYVSQLCTFIGVLAYRNVLAPRWTTRTIFRLAAMLVLAAQLSALPVYTRSLSDSPILDKSFILLEEAVLVIANSLTDIPLFLLLSRCCSGANDTTVLALCSTARHMCSPVSVYGGIILVNLFQVNADGSLDDARKFENLWRLKAIVAFLGVLPAIIFLDRMIPAGKAT